jgi:hypothetical protein
MNQSIKKINKDIRLGLRLNQSEYNILKAMYPNNISLAIRELIRNYAIKNNLNIL